MVEEELARFSPEKDTFLTIGVFDGVHLGHKHLLSKLVEQARQRDLLPGVVTFRQHPQELLSPQNRLAFLTDLTERSKLLKEEGVELVVMLSFTAELRQLSARQFVSLLVKYLRMRGLLIGPDFALGRDREGTVAALRPLGEEMGFTVAGVPPLIINGEPVSSTAIRAALAAGDVKKAQALSNRPFSLHGKVVTGTGRGVGLGFPTANLGTDPWQAVPADGVYAAQAHVNGRVYRSVANIGTNPTFGGSKRTVEVYVLDYDGNLYGKEFKIDIIERLRDEKPFGSAGELAKQIEEDVKQGRIILQSIDGE